MREPRGRAGMLAPPHPAPPRPAAAAGGNFLFDENSGMINLIDFGAARDYPPHFVDEYLHMVKVRWLGVGAVQI